MSENDFARPFEVQKYLTEDGEDESKPPRDKEPLPAGDYELQVDWTRIDDLENGKALLVRYIVVSPPEIDEDRKLFDRFWLNHRNAEAARVGRSRLATLCSKVGILELRSASELEWKCVGAKVHVDGQYNRLTNYRKIDQIDDALPPEDEFGNHEDGEQTDDIPF